MGGGIENLCAGVMDWPVARLCVGVYYKGDARKFSRIKYKREREREREKRRKFGGGLVFGVMRAQGCGD